MSDLKQDDTGTAIVPVLACVLNQLCLRNDRLPSSSKALSKFHALRAPAISIRDYLARVAKYSCCSGECFVLSLVYIDRIIQANPAFVVNSLNVHRLLITAIMLAAKFFDDQYYNNAYYAKIGGIACGEINSLEVEFLFMCNFTLFVTADTYSQYYTELKNHASVVSSVCECSQGPQVPKLILKDCPGCSFPPPQLDGYVHYVLPQQLQVNVHVANQYGIVSPVSGVSGISSAIGGDDHTIAETESIFYTAHGANLAAETGSSSSASRGSKTSSSSSSSSAAHQQQLQHHQQQQYYTQQKAQQQQATR